MQAYNEAGTKVGALVETTAKNVTINGLTANQPYFFTVKAKNAGGYGPETAKLALTPTRLTDRVTIGTASWKARDFRVTGTASVVGSIVTVYPAKADGTIDRSRSLGAPRSPRRPRPPPAASTASACGTARPRPPTPVGSSSSPTAAAWPDRSRSPTASRPAATAAPRLTPGPVAQAAGPGPFLRAAFSRS